MIMIVMHLCEFGSVGSEWQGRITSNTTDKSIPFSDVWCFASDL